MRKKFVCFCEDVTQQEMREAVDQGFRDIESLKRFTSTFMGPCQGKLCGMAAIKTLAEMTARSVEEIGVPTSRPPIRPVSMGALAKAYRASKPD